MLLRTLSYRLTRPLTQSYRNAPFKRTWSSLTPTPTGITIHALDNTAFPYIWLRDSCQSSPDCIHPSNKQKLHRTSDIPLDARPASLDSDGIRVTDQGLEITWSDGHESVFSRAFLERYSDERRLSEFHKDFSAVSWDNQSIRRRTEELFVPYDTIRTSRGLVKGIEQLAKYGLLFVTEVPNKETSDEECGAKKLAEIFGEIRPTLYGYLWDVVNMKESKNIAYTNLDLGLHMDLLYLEHPPRYQILHCLRNRVHGGTSIFVDALAAAEKLRTVHPEHFGVLARSPVAFHFINDEHHLHWERPTIELAPPSSLSPSAQRPISHLNYSPPFQAPLPLNTPMEFYPALKEFTKRLNDPKNTYEYTLREGDAVIFDNRRVLHARTAFHDREDNGVGDNDYLTGKGGEVNRWLKGCYFEADTMMDRGRILRTKMEQGLIEQADKI
ncbi:gamma-butyrobetaine hydroxylase [Macrolepiota fuliginosa MF-IS2]|uniref:Gamma-butyrobetaine hydroxylase n=1 Tax=Macrolepiota fuliginosa MF-IS2 TaxID=1400762 RepID=A0A9P5XMW9_9AGAR|nr:gamma-butyrobetaine hydroxylase [Macrolepiota fuliginosa MF-IS2]